VDQIPDSPGLMSLSAYARHRGVTPPAVTLAIQRGLLRDAVRVDDKGRKRIDVAAADAEWPMNTSRPPQSAGADVEGEEVTASDASTREKHWKAKLAELKYKTEAGELVPASLVDKRLRDVFTQCKTRLLGVPTRARQALPHLTGADVGVLEALVREALSELADGGAGG
jgi:phage terminase Nu1 subunit (DNA packaging protein)